MIEASFTVLYNGFYKNDSILFTSLSPIIKYLSDDFGMYILVDKDELNSDNNVFGYSLDGDLLWQIEEMHKIHAQNYLHQSIFRKINSLLIM